MRNIFRSMLNVAGIALLLPTLVLGEEKEIHLTVTLSEKAVIGFTMFNLKSMVADGSAFLPVPLLVAGRPKCDSYLSSIAKK